MIDAYTIGIRLALSDDLSRGLAAVQRRLAGLDGAVSRSGAALRALGRLSTEIAPPDFSRPGTLQARRSEKHARPAAPSSAAAPGGAALAEAAGPQPVRHSRLVSGAMSLPDSTAAVRLLRSRPPAPPGGNQGFRRAGEALPQRRTEAFGLPPAWAKQWSRTSPVIVGPPALPRLRTAVREGAEGSGTAGAAHRGLQAQVAAAPPPAKAQYGAPARRPDGAFIPDGRDFAAFAHDLLAAVSASWTTGQSGRRQDGADPGQAQAPRMPAGSGDAGRWSAPKVSGPDGARRAAPTGRIETRPDRPAVSLSSASRRAAAPTLPLSRDRTTTPFRHLLGADAAAGAGAVQPIAPDPLSAGGGEIIIDGLRFGRLICDQLARHIDRPRAGLTGADPRLTPTWPGAAWG